ncbi:MAG: hypothetical protein IJH95_00375 [Mogibacterium sp.]|nr:hypothetical protein [Mogibacterium sp.]
MSMKLGLIGNPLAHSWSPEIHNFILGDSVPDDSIPGDGCGGCFPERPFSYSLWPLEQTELEEFFEKRDFDGINVTIPYKTEVIRFLDELDDSAAVIGAVNCVVNDGGRLKGYNTDAAGLDLVIQRCLADSPAGAGAAESTAETAITDAPGSNMMAAILGTGGASRAAEYVCRQRGIDYRLVSRDPARATGASSGTKPNNATDAGIDRGRAGRIISYEELYSEPDRYTLLINTTPVGMHPNEDGMPVDLSRLTSLRALVDVVANPVRSRLVFEAGQLGINARGGLEMLVAQALVSDELFTGRRLDRQLIDRCVDHLLRTRRNIILIGMPSSGKTTVARMLAGQTDMPMLDMDAQIERQSKMSIPRIFAAQGEEAFRDMETELCRKLQDRQGHIISTGGGVVKRKENMRMLSHNGLIVWLDRDPALLELEKGRPLVSTAGDYERLHLERGPLYERYCDIHIINNGTPEDAARKILSFL